MATEDTRPGRHGRRRALSPCAHADPLPRWRDDRHRFSVPARHRARQGPHRLRDVPGQPERIGSQPDPVRVRRGRPGRDAADPCPSRPLRPDPAPGQGRLPRPDPCDRRQRSSSRHSSSSTRASSTRSSPSARRVGRSVTPTRSRPTTDAKPTSTRPPSTWPQQGRRRQPRPLRGPPTAIEAAVATEHVETTIEAVPEPGDPPSAWPRDPEADLRAQPPHLVVDLDAPLYTAKDAERSLAQFKAVRYDQEVEIAPGSVRHSSTPGTSSAHRSSGSASRTRRAARNGSSSAPVTSDGPARRSCATRPR